MKKNTLLLIAAAGIGIYLFMQMRRRRGTVSVTDAEIISEEQFTRSQPSIPEPSVIEKVLNVTQKLFPPRTAKQKAARKAKAVPSAVPIQFRGLSTAAAAAQAAAKKKKKAKVGNVDMLSVLV